MDCFEYMESHSFDWMKLQKLQGDEPVGRVMDRSRKRDVSVPYGQKKGRPIFEIHSLLGHSGGWFYVKLPEKE